MKDVDRYAKLLSIARELVKEQKRQDKLIAKRAEMSPDTHTQKSIGNAGAAISFGAMALDKLRHEAHAAAVDCGIAEPRDSYAPVTYYPSPLHVYQYQPPLPACRRITSADHP